MQGQRSVLLGLIGFGIQGSLTPAMHEQEGAAQESELVYKLIDLQKLDLTVKALPELLIAAERMRFRRSQYYLPLQAGSRPLLTDLSDNARALGAVNTVVLQDGKRVGHNTDLFGYAENLRRGLPDVQRDRVVQVGAGGAGSAVAEALMQLDVQHLTVFDTDNARAQHVAADLCSRHGVGPPRPAAISNARSPKRMDWSTPARSAWPNCRARRCRRSSFAPISGSRRSLLPPGNRAAERARAIGCRTLDGGGMATFQAVRASSCSPASNQTSTGCAGTSTNCERLLNRNQVRRKPNMSGSETHHPGKAPVEKSGGERMDRLGFGILRLLHIRHGCLARFPQIFFRPAIRLSQSSPRSRPMASATWRGLSAPSSSGTGATRMDAKRCCSSACS